MFLLHHWPIHKHGRFGDASSAQQASAARGDKRRFQPWTPAKSHTWAIWCCRGYVCLHNVNLWCVFSINPMGMCVPCSGNPKTRFDGAWCNARAPRCCTVSETSQFKLLQPCWSLSTEALGPSHHSVKSHVPVSSRRYLQQSLDSEIDARFLPRLQQVTHVSLGGSSWLNSLWMEAASQEQTTT